MPPAVAPSLLHHVPISFPRLPAVHSRREPVFDRLRRVEHPTSGAIVNRLSTIATHASAKALVSAAASVTDLDAAADAAEGSAEEAPSADGSGVDFEPSLKALQDWAMTLDAMQQACAHNFVPITRPRLHRSGLTRPRWLH